MFWMGVLLQLMIPAGITLYTVNFGRWMARRGEKLGAFGAYLIAGITFAMAVWVELRNNG